MSLQTLIKNILRFGGVYLLLEIAIHFSNIRLSGTQYVWPVSAIAFSGFLSQIYASFVLLAALIAFEIQRDLKKYQSIVFIVGIWSLLHGAYLAYQLTSNFSNNFKAIPSLYLGLHYYNWIVTGESALLIIFGVIVVIWKIKNERTH